MCLPAFLIAMLSASSPRAALSAAKGRSLLASNSLGFHDVQTHIASGTANGTNRGVQVSGVEIDKLDFRDLLDLLLGHFADFIAIRLRRTLCNSRSAQQQHRRWRG